MIINSLQVLEKIKSSVGEVGSLAKKWKEVIGELDAAKSLLEIHSLLQESQKAESNKMYSVSADCLLSVRTSDFII